MDILSFVVGVVVGGAISTVVIAKFVACRLADAEAETARLRSMICQLRDDNRRSTARMNVSTHSVESVEQFFKDLASHSRNQGKKRGVSE